jgi:hypothetical protein
MAKGFAHVAIKRHCLLVFSSVEMDLPTEILGASEAANVSAVALSIITTVIMNTSLKFLRLIYIDIHTRANVFFGCVSICVWNTIFGLPLRVRVCWQNYAQCT